MGFFSDMFYNTFDPKYGFLGRPASGALRSIIDFGATLDPLKKGANLASAMGIPGAEDLYQWRTQQEEEAKTLLDEFLGGGFKEKMLDEPVSQAAGLEEPVNFGEMFKNAVMPSLGPGDINRNVTEEFMTPMGPIPKTRTLTPEEIMASSRIGEQLGGAIESVADIATDPMNLAIPTIPRAGLAFLPGIAESLGTNLGTGDYGKALVDTLFGGLVAGHTARQFRGGPKLSLSPEKVGQVEVPEGGFRVPEELGARAAAPPIKFERRVPIEKRDILEQEIDDILNVEGFKLTPEFLGLDEGTKATLRALDTETLKADIASLGYEPGGKISDRFDREYIEYGNQILKEREGREADILPFGKRSEAPPRIEDIDLEALMAPEKTKISEAETFNTRFGNMTTGFVDRIKEEAARVLGDESVKDVKVVMAPLKGTHAQFERKTNTMYLDPTQMADATSEQIVDTVLHELAHTKEYHDPLLETKTGEIQISPETVAEVNPRLAEHTEPNIDLRAAVSPGEHVFQTGRDILQNSPEIRAIGEEFSRNLKPLLTGEFARRRGLPPAESIEARKAAPPSEKTQLQPPTYTIKNGIKFKVIETGKVRPDTFGEEGRDFLHQVIYEPVEGGSSHLGWMPNSELALRRAESSAIPTEAKVIGSAPPIKPSANDPVVKFVDSKRLKYGDDWASKLSDDEKNVYNSLLKGEGEFVAVEDVGKALAPEEVKTPLEQAREAVTSTSEKPNVKWRVTFNDGNTVLVDAPDRGTAAQIGRRDFAEGRKIAGVSESSPEAISGEKREGIQEKQSTYVVTLSDGTSRTTRAYSESQARNAVEKPLKAIGDERTVTSIHIREKGEDTSPLSRRTGGELTRTTVIDGPIVGKTALPKESIVRPDQASLQEWKDFDAAAKLKSDEELKTGLASAIADKDLSRAAMHGWALVERGLMDPKELGRLHFNIPYEREINVIDIKAEVVDEAKTKPKYDPWKKEAPPVPETVVTPEEAPATKAQKVWVDPKYKHTWKVVKTEGEVAYLERSEGGKIKRRTIYASELEKGKPSPPGTKVPETVTTLVKGDQLEAVTEPGEKPLKTKPTKEQIPVPDKGVPDEIAADTDFIAMMKDKGYERDESAYSGFTKKGGPVASSEVWARWREYDRAGDLIDRKVRKKAQDALNAELEEINQKIVKQADRDVWDKAVTEARGLKDYSKLIDKIEREQGAEEARKVRELVRAAEKETRETFKAEEALRKAQTKEKFKKEAYEVTFSNGRTVTIRARSEKSAREYAMSQARKTKPGITVSAVAKKPSALEAAITGVSKKVEESGILRTPLAKFLGTIKSIAFGGDVGHLLRQGKQMNADLLFSGHAKKVLDQFPVIFKSAKSQEFFDEFHKNLYSDPDIKMMVDNFNLDMPGLGEHLREEVFHGSPAENIPIVGKYYAKPSERAYTAGLNFLRGADVKKWVGNLRKKGFTPENAPEKYAAVSRAINIISQRGDFNPAYQKVFSDASLVYGAPRAKAARLQNYVELVKGGTSADIARVTAAKTLAFNAGMLGLLKMTTGGELITDPERSDFLKFRINDKISVDPWMGLGVTARTIAKIYTGKSVSPYSNKVRTVAPGEAIGNELSGGLAPGVKLLVEGLTGRDTRGYQVDRVKSLLNVTPLTARNIVELLNSGETEDAFLLAMLQAGGEGVDVFDYEAAREEEAKLKEQRGISSGRKKQRYSVPSW